MATLVDIPEELIPLQGFLAEGMGLVEGRMQKQLASDLPPVQRLCKHVERYHGKMIRPALVFLSGLAGRGEDRVPGVHDEKAVVIASVCEMVHLATLVHDDVLDEADTRRRTQTVNSLRGNEAAVILGDYLFSAAFNLCSQLSDQRTSLRIAEVGMTLCAGELLQLDHREDFSLDEPTYFEIVKRKTASLIGAACELGARHAVGTSGESPARLERFGMALGVAFQIQDDLLDLTGDQAVVGKSLGKDLEKGKLTLPIIHHLGSAEAAQRGRTLAILADATGERFGDAHTRGGLLRSALEQTGSIEHARGVAEGLVREAREAIAPLKETPAKKMLNLMADAVVTRSW